MSFEPAFRYNNDEIDSHCTQILQSDFYSTLLDEIPNFVLILNDARQIIYANKAFMNILEANFPENIWGMRPGECMNCVRSTSHMEGCGSGKHCNVCGFAQMIRISEEGKSGTGECNMVVKGGDTLSLSVYTRPFVHHNKRYVFCQLQDISKQRAHDFFERSFLHDIQNSVSVLYALHEVLEHLSPLELKNTIKDLSNKLNEEVNAYKLISNAEINNISIRPESIDVSALVSKTTDELLNIKAFRNKKINIHSESGVFLTDRTLLRRIVMNLIKNAFEASADHEEVDVIIKQSGDHCDIKVKSIPVIANEVQMQLFQKSFSTKGKGRGWGTYSIRLLTENYLKGTVSLVSNSIDRTVFTVSIPQSTP
jgi:hypothetical protein